jgi:hypothetical protein
VNLLWGAIPVPREAMERTDPVELAREVARQLALGEPGHHVLLVRGFHDDPARNSPSVTVIPL